MTTEIVLGLVVIAQLGIIYGLTNRMMKLNGLAQMNIRKSLDQAIQDAVGLTPRAEKSAKPERAVRESYKVGL